VNKSRGIQILIVLVAIYILYSVGQTLYQNWQIDQQVNGLQAQINTLKSGIATDKKNIAYYQSPAYLNYIARERLDLENPGEQEMIVEPDQTPVVTNQKPKDTRSNYQKWWDYFFGG
jgi:cell division protein FtsB